MASATGPVNPPCGLLDLQSLPSLERFDSRFLDIFRDTGNEAGAGGVPVMDELQAPDDDLALQRLMSLRNGQQKAAAVSRLQQYDFSEAPATHHTSHSPETPHAQPPHHHHHHHHGSASYTNMSSDPNQQPHHSSSGMEDCPASSAAAAVGGGYDLTLTSSQLAAAHQYMMSQAAAAGGDGSVGFVPGSASGMQHMAMSTAAALPIGSDMMPIASNATMHASSFAASASVPFGISGIDLCSLAAADCGDPHSPLAGNLAGAFAGTAADAGTLGGKRRSRGSCMGDYIKAEQDGAALMMMDCDSGLASLLGEGAAALAGMGEQLHQLEMEEAAAAGGGSSKRSRGSRGQAVAADFGGDSDFDGQEARAAALSIMPDMDEDTRARIRREKNRVAARKCRAKKMAFMVELQKTLRELMRKNEEYRLQVITWHKMFSREVRLREAMKRIISVMWQSGVAPAASGYTANDVIIGLESGTLDVNRLVRALASLNAPPAHSGLSINTAAATAAAAELAGQVNAHTPSHAQLAAANHNNGNSPSHHGLAPPAPLVFGSPTAAAAAAVASHMAGGAAAGVGVPATPHAAAAASQLLALQQQQQQQQQQGEGGLCGTMAGDRSAADVLPGLADSTTGGTTAAAGGTVVCSSPLSGEHTEAKLPMSLLSAQYSHISNNSTANLPGTLSGAHGSATVQMQIAMSTLAAGAAAAGNGGDVGAAAAAAAAAGLAAGYGVMPGLPDLGGDQGAGGTAGGAVFAGLEGYVLGGGSGQAGGVAGSGPSCITTGAQD